MKKLGVVITDGVGFRNFIMSDFLAEAVNQFDTIIIYSGLPESCYPKLNNLKLEIKELSVFKEGKTTWAFRKWKEIAHLQKHKNFYGMNDNLVVGYPKNNSLRSIFVKSIYFFTKYVNTNSSILLAEKLQFLSFSKNKITKEYIEILKKDRPSHLFLRIRDLHI
jgi:hypothetical protein